MIDRLIAVRRALAEARRRRRRGVGWPRRSAKEYARHRRSRSAAGRLPAGRPAAAARRRSPVTRPGRPGLAQLRPPGRGRPTGDVVYLPVTVRGERIGVLRCSPGAGRPARCGPSSPRSPPCSRTSWPAAATGTDRYTMAARTRRLTLAAEMQWELLPGRSRIRPSFSLAGQLEPSYAVRGDSFDWAEHEGRLYLTVLNGMGEGVTAALLTSLATYALRNARRAGLAWPTRPRWPTRRCTPSTAATRTWRRCCSSSTWPPARCGGRRRVAAADAAARRRGPRP